MVGTTDRISVYNLLEHIKFEHIDVDARYRVRLFGQLVILYSKKTCLTS